MSSAAPSCGVHRDASGPSRRWVRRRPRSPPGSRRRRGGRATSSVELDADEVEQRDADRALERRRRREPGPDRHPAVDEQVDARYVVPGLAERPQHPDGVAGPAVDRTRAELAERALPDLLLLAAGHPDQLVGARPGGGVRRVGERHRKDQAGVVVGVLADQVHPSGRATEARGRLAVPVRERGPRRSGQGRRVTGVDERHGAHPRERVSPASCGRCGLGRSR